MDQLLARFDISKEIGFLLEEPATELPQDCAPWQEITKNMISLVNNGKVRDKILQLPLLNTESLKTEKDLRLAHLELCTLMAGYVWSQPEKELPKTLPKQIAVPLWEVSEKLGVAKCTSHMTVCLANHRRVDKKLPMRADNMRTISFKFIEDFGNEWFFLNAAQVELAFAPAIEPMSSSVLDCGNLDILTENLEKISIAIRNMTNSFLQIDKHLKPEVFFHGFRPYLSGFSAGEYEKWGGIIFEGYEKYGAQKFSGASAAQTSTFQALDSFLGIKHHKECLEFLNDQRNYMPVKHKSFFGWLDSESKIRETVLGNRENSNLVTAYNNCIQELVLFRNQHLRTVTRYIIMQRNGGLKNHEFLNDVGTGGTGFMHFLKNVRNVTENHRIVAETFL